MMFEENIDFSLENRYSMVQRHVMGTIRYRKMTNLGGRRDSSR